MSHVTGTVQPVTPPLTIGPDSGAAPSPPGTWAVEFTHDQAPGGTKLLILHFRNANLPAGNRLEVDLGYGTDVFTAADGPDFWTRPVNPYVIPNGRVPIRYVAAGVGAGGVQLDTYGRGERHAGEQDPTSLSNCDPFLGDPSYTEPKYDPFWFCQAPPSWENIRCVPAGDIRADVAPSVGLITHVDEDHLSTCTVTLVGPDLVLTAGHCMSDTGGDGRLAARSSSVTFDYEVGCDGARPAGYAARFFKVTDVVSHTYLAGEDYSLLRLAVPPGGLGIPPVQMRHDLPGTGERIFGIHHPNGAVKKLSIPHPSLDTVIGSSATAINVPGNFHVSGGSSGSGLFDEAGRVTGVLSNGTPCSMPSSPLRYWPTSSILPKIAQPPPGPVLTRDVMVVIDRSGSMTLPGASGRPKIEEARDAVSLFVQLVRAETGNRVGAVSFSTAASAPVEAPLAPLTGAAKTFLVGPPPFVGGVIGALTPDGMTSIGGGLEAARLQFPAPGANPRSVLLLTDGLQNTPPMIKDVEGSLAGIAIQAIGYGTPASLDGALLTALATSHGGTYARADTNLKLEKFFAQAFGNIFEKGLLQDPEYFMPGPEDVAAPVPFTVCGEETITVVVGWDRTDSALAIDVITPAGVVINRSTPGIEHSEGRTWKFLRIPLPHGAERDGGWQVLMRRVRGGGEFPPPGEDLHYFISIVASGGPRLVRMPDSRRYYTGDAINPLVQLTYDGAGTPEAGSVEVTVERPNAGVGNALAANGLGQPQTIGADTIPARQATLIAMEQASGAPVIGHTHHRFDLFDDPANADGSFEAAGVFGIRFTDLLTMEGDYTFHFRAVYGAGCRATRELVWSVHVDVGIDPSQTVVVTHPAGSGPGGSKGVTFTITPKDKHGNLVGPGRPTDIDLTGGPGTVITGPPVDNGDGSYTVPGTWNPGSGQPPAVVIGQPGRPPIVVSDPKTGPAKGCLSWKLLCLLLLLVVIVLLILLLI